MPAASRYGCDRAPPTMRILLLMPSLSGTGGAERMVDGLSGSCPRRASRRSRPRSIHPGRAACSKIPRPSIRSGQCRDCHCLSGRSNISWRQVEPRPATNGVKRFLRCGRMSPEKNVAGPLLAWRAFASAERGAQLVLLGDGPQRPELESLAADLGLSAASSTIQKPKSCSRVWWRSPIWRAGVARPVAPPNP